MLLQGKHAVVHVHKVVDTVHDLPNVLWGVASESLGRRVSRRPSRSRSHGFAAWNG
jgi:hypothetical protein